MLNNTTKRVNDNHEYYYLSWEKEKLNKEKYKEIAARWQTTEKAPYVSILNESGEILKKTLLLIICFLSEKSKLIP